MAKLEKILEAMDTFRIDSDVALLENENLDALTVAQTKKVLHESFNFIKGQLIQGGLLEDTQNMLANVWTQAIMEDIDMSHLPMIQPEDDGMGAELAGAAGVAGAGAAGARYLPGAANAFNQYRQQDQSLADSAKVAAANVKSGIVGDINAGRNMAGQAAADAGRAVQNGALKADIIARNAVGQAGQAINNQVGAAAAGAAGISGPTKPGTQAAYNAGAVLGKVKRAFKK